MVSRISATRQPGNALVAACRIASSAPGFRDAIRSAGAEIVPASSDKIDSTAAKATAHIRTKSKFEGSIFEGLPVVCPEGRVM